MSWWKWEPEKHVPQTPQAMQAALNDFVANLSDFKNKYPAEFERLRPKWFEKRKVSGQTVRDCRNRGF